MGQDISPRAPPPCFRGPEQGQVLAVVVVAENVLLSGPATGLWREGSVHKNWRDLSHLLPPSTQCNQECLLCPCRLPGTVLEMNRVDPAIAPREHSGHLHFAFRLIGLLGKGRRPSGFFSPTLSQ